jgi:hypothetical protein
MSSVTYLHRTGTVSSFPLLQAILLIKCDASPSETVNFVLYMPHPWHQKTYTVEELLGRVFRGNVVYCSECIYTLCTVETLSTVAALPPPSYFSTLYWSLPPPASTTFLDYLVLVNTHPPCPCPSSCSTMPALCHNHDLATTPASARHVPVSASIHSAALSLHQQLLPLCCSTTPPVLTISPPTS